MRLRITELGKKCTGCCACANACNEDAITMVADEEGFHYPKIIENKCINCSQCDSICPEINYTSKEPEINEKAFYGWHKDETIRLRSSSGGIFSAIAEEIIYEGGLVFGAVFDMKQKMLIVGSTAKYCMDDLRKSKYVQCYSGLAFREIKSILDENKLKVLFVGTPCQVAGLKSYLKKDYENILLCDFICHGVSSNKLLNHHIELLERKYKSSIAAIDFRPKTNGWSQQTIKCKFQNGKTYEQSYHFDAYFNAFMKNLNLRSCCYECSYSAKPHYFADITLADFWGYHRYNKAINDEKGISLIIVNTNKGMSFIDKIKPTKVELFDLEWKYASYVFESRNAEDYGLKKRNEVMDYWLKNSWKKTIKKYELNGSWRERLKYKLRKKLKKIL